LGQRQISEAALRDAIDRVSEEWFSEPGRKEPEKRRRIEGIVGDRAIVSAPQEAGKNRGRGRPRKK
jgi:hypothetical protein